MSVPGCTGPAEGFDQKPGPSLNRRSAARQPPPAFSTTPPSRSFSLPSGRRKSSKSPSWSRTTGRSSASRSIPTAASRNTRESTWWRQSVAHVPATIPHLFAYLREARKRNICLIRGAPANLERQPTRRQKAGVVGRATGAITAFSTYQPGCSPSTLTAMQINWRADPEERDPGPSSRGSASHGPRRRSCGCSRQRTGLSRFDPKPARSANAGPATSLRPGTGADRIHHRTCAERGRGQRTDQHRPRCLFPSSIRRSARRVQPNYIQRPHWVEHPDRDVLGDIPTIGWVKGTHDYLAVPDDLTHTARWAKAQGHSSDIADHPDAESAVRGIGSDGRVRAAYDGGDRCICCAPIQCRRW